MNVRSPANSSVIEIGMHLERRVAADHLHRARLDGAVEDIGYMSGAADVPPDRGVFEDIRGLDPLEVERVNGHVQMPGDTRGPRLDHAVADLHGPGVDGGRAYFEPADRPEEPSPPNVQVAGDAHRVDPNLADVLGDDVIELDRPEVVVCVRQGRGLRSHVAERRIGETRHRRQRGHPLGRRGVRAQPYPQAQSVAPHPVSVKLGVREIREGNAEVAAVDQEDPLDVAVAAANAQAFHVDAAGPDRVGARVVDE